MASVLVLVVAGCSSSVDDAKGASASALGEGCAPDASCFDRSPSGALCRPLCAPECQTKHFAAELWASPYEVAGSYTLGRHQGLAIVAVEYAFDTRDDAAKGASAALTSLPADMAASLLGTDETGHDHSRATVCSVPKVTLDRPLANHGRVLSREPEHATSRLSIARYAADTPPGHDTPVVALYGKAGQTNARVTQCLDRIQNGYCDAVCGNCSYVLPAEAILSSRAGDWSLPSNHVAGVASCDESEYFGGPDQVGSATFTGLALPDPFTHCARLGCGRGDEAPCVSAVVAERSNAPITGLYGHNSNTDAEAELSAFVACAEGRSGFAEACTACGEGLQGRQDPCEGKTNTATSLWKHTAAPGGVRPDDLVAPITDPKAGGHLPAPQCAWGGFAVNGM